MLKVKRIKIFIVFVVITLIFFLFTNFVMPLYFASDTELAPEKVVPESAVCEYATSTDHEISEYSYNEEIGSIIFVEQDIEVPLLYGDPEEAFVTAMDLGAAYDPNSSYPGGDTTTVISGHKHTDFGVLEDIQLGDSIVLEIDGNTYVYEVTDLKVIKDTDVDSVYYNKNDLVLYTCYPFTYSAFYSQRYAVIASPVEKVSC